MRLIDADKEIERYARYYLCPTPDVSEFEKGNAIIIVNALRKMETVEVRPKGKWNWHGDEYICNCPYCDFEIDAEGCIDPVEHVKIYNYCPRCGADMRGEE